MVKTSHSKQYYAMRNGYRSGLEESVNEQLKASGAAYFYEDRVLHYQKPVSSHKYTPDFLLIRGGGGKEIYIETKGYFTAEDRKKHLLVRESNPYIDLRFVFSNPRNKISKRSKTTYADWCKKNDFKYATKTVPKEWLEEIE